MKRKASFHFIQIIYSPGSGGSSATGRGNYRHMVFLMAIGVGNKIKVGKRAGVGAFG